jgi:uncharacterized protein YecE (DUF72 family)
MSQLRLGACSWKYESWEGLVYSKRKGINYLQEYAQHFDTVEVDQWFWSLFGEERVVLPAPEVVEEYSRSVPDSFRFSVKAPNSITLTHFYQKNRSGPLTTNPHFLSLELFGQFLDRLAPMRERLGPIMFQFEYLNRQKMPSQKEFLRRFSDFLSGLPKGLTLALETRNPNYLNHALFEFLENRQIACVLLQGYYMPSILEVIEKHRDFFLRQKLVVLRLHGPDRENMEKAAGKQWNRIVSSKQNELPPIVSFIRELLAQGVDVFVNVNNHYEGSAPLTIQTIRGLMETAGPAPNKINLSPQ